MIRRLLFLLLAVVAIYWWLRRALARAAPPAGRAERRVPRAAGGPMVRDRVCNTFVPADRAVVHREGAEDRYFCSRACLERFLSAASEPVSEADRRAPTGGSVR